MIRTGIGGWSYAGWCGGAFYPPRLPHKEELAFASRAVAAIEINATFHRLQKPDSFRQWREEAPDGFMFTIKGSRFVTNRKVLASAKEPLERFFGQGLEQLGDRLGPIVWQLAATKRFEPADLAAFLALLPREVAAGLPLRHAIEVGHESFACAQFVDLAREAGVAIVWSEHPQRVRLAEHSGGFAYLRCQDLSPDEPTGYPPAGIERIAALCREWDKQGDVFAFMINGAKERAPAAAQALAARVRHDSMRESG
jgi:uncharacterized protein YecE (DUF72 family)